MLRDYEELISSVLENGIKGNEKISDLQLASYITGKLCYKIEREKEGANKPRVKFWALNQLAFQETSKSPYIFTKTLKKMAIHGECLDEMDKKLFANLCADLGILQSDEMDSPSFLAGYMNNNN